MCPVRTPASSLLLPAWANSLVGIPGVAVAHREPPSCQALASQGQDGAVLGGQDGSWGKT